MRLQELKENRYEPSGYVYHASVLSMTRKDISKVMKHGLLPSETGYSGPGVYFSQTPSGCYSHVEPENSVLFRAKWNDLVSLYGKYRDNNKGIQWDEDEIIVPGKVPAKILEIEFFPEEWWDLESAFLTLSRAP